MGILLTIYLQDSPKGSRRAYSKNLIITDRMTSQIEISPIPVPSGSAINFGATVTNVDVENLTGKPASSQVT